MSAEKGVKTDKVKKCKRSFELIMKICTGILIPITLFIISSSITRNLQKSKDIDIFLDYSSKLEESFRPIRNYFGELVAGCENSLSTFRERLTRLDSNMVIFYFKTMMISARDVSKFKKTPDFMDELYWGKQDIGYERSFREFLIKVEEFARNNKDKFFPMIYKDTKDVLQYFDDLMHLSMLQISFSIHTQEEKISPELYADMNELEKKVNSSKEETLVKMRSILKICNAR